MLQKPGGYCDRNRQTYRLTQGLHLCIDKFKKLVTWTNGDAVNPIVNTVLPHDIFEDWVWRQLGMNGKLDGVALLMTDPPPTSSTSLHYYNSGFF